MTRKIEGRLQDESKSEFTSGCEMEGEWDGKVSRQKDAGNAKLSLDLFLYVTLRMHRSDSKVRSSMAKRGF